VKGEMERTSAGKWIDVLVLTVPSAPGGFSEGKAFKLLLSVLLGVRRRLPFVPPRSA